MDLRLHSYLQNLLETAHHINSDDAKSMPEPLKEKLLADLNIQLEQRLAAALLEKLSNEDQSAFEELAASDSTQTKMLDFLNSKVPDATNIVKATLQQFEQDYIKIVNRGTSHNKSHVK